MSSAQEPPQSEDDRTPDEIRSDIEQTREELGDTVEALAAKSDVKARARGRVDEIKASATAKKDELTAKVKDAAPGGGGDSDSADRADAPQDSTPSAAANAQVKAKEASQQALTVARENPIPFAVAGSLVLGYLVGRAVSR